MTTCGPGQEGLRAPAAAVATPITVRQLYVAALLAGGRIQWVTPADLFQVVDDIIAAERGGRQA